MNKSSTFNSRIMIISFLVIISIFSFIIVSLYHNTLKQEKCHINDIVRGEVKLIEAIVSSESFNNSIIKENLSTEEYEKYFIKLLKQIYSESNYFNKTKAS